MCGDVRTNENNYSMSSRKYNTTKARDELPAVGSHHNGNAEVYMMHKISKLRDNNKFYANETKIFNKCVMFVNGVTNPPVEELRRLIGIHGGECVNYRVSEVTHFVCDYLTDAQLKREYSKTKLLRSNVYNVQAKWIVDSIEANRRLDENLYAPSGLKGQFGHTIASLFSKRDDGGILPPSKKSKIDVAAPIQIININDSPSAMGLTSSQEDFIQSVPLEDLQSDILEQLIEHNKAKRMIQNCLKESELVWEASQDKFYPNDPLPRTSLSSSTAPPYPSSSSSSSSSLSLVATSTLLTSSAAVSAPTVVLSSSVNNACSSRSISGEVCTKEKIDGLFEMIQWIHVGSTADISTTLIIYLEQLIRTFSGITVPTNDCELLYSTTFLQKLLTCYGKWLLQNEMLDILAIFIRALKRVCSRIKTATSSLSSSSSTLSLEAAEGNRWHSLASDTERDIQMMVLSSYRCYLKTE